MFNRLNKLNWHYVAYGTFVLIIIILFLLLGGKLRKIEQIETELKTSTANNKQLSKEILSLQKDTDLLIKGINDCRDSLRNYIDSLKFEKSLIAVPIIGKEITKNGKNGFWIGAKKVSKGKEWIFFENKVDTVNKIAYESTLIDSSYLYKNLFMDFYFNDTLFYLANLKDIISVNGFPSDPILRVDRNYTEMYRNDNISCFSILRENRSFQFSYNFNKVVIDQKKLKTGKWFYRGGVILSNLSALLYYKTQLTETPYYIKEDGLGFYDKNNSYAEHNKKNDKYLKSIRMQRGGSIIGYFLGEGLQELGNIKKQNAYKLVPVTFNHVFYF